MKKLLSLVIILFTFPILTSCSKKVATSSLPSDKNIVEEEKETEEIIPKEDLNITPTDTILEKPEEVLQEVTESTPIDPIFYTGFGIIHEIASPYDTPYIIIDEAEFLRGEEAREEALKRGLGYFDENGVYVLPNSYYIKNDYDILTEYPISENCTYYLSSWIIQDYLGKEVPIGLSSDSYEVSFEDFNQIVELEDFRFNTWFECEDGYVVKLYHQFTP